MAKKSISVDLNLLKGLKYILSLISPRILRILTGYYGRPCSLSFVVVVVCRSSFVVVRCNAFSLSPQDFSERLKIWNFGNNKKVTSRREDVQEKNKFRKKSFFWPVASFLVENLRFSCSPMISLNVWRYEILVITKKFRLDVKMCKRKKKSEKSHFFGLWRHF